MDGADLSRDHKLREYITFLENVSGLKFSVAVESRGARVRTMRFHARQEMEIPDFNVDGIPIVLRGMLDIFP